MSNVTYKPGDIAFFRSAKKSSRLPSKQEGEFKGHGFGVFLGVVPPFGRDPKPEDLWRLMGSAGFLSFDDVLEFLGQEIGNGLIEKFQDKYRPKAVREPVQPVLIDAAGNPIETTIQ